MEKKQQRSIQKQGIIDMLISFTIYLYPVSIQTKDFETGINS
jgi:hypothetical protein